jgi:hypothetical protein
MNKRSWQDCAEPAARELPGKARKDLKMPLCGATGGAKGNCAASALMKDGSMAMRKPACIPGVKRYAAADHAIHGSSRCFAR